MKNVYDLKEDLRRNPMRLQLARALTLNQDRPTAGLRGAKGIFGSDEWWENVRLGVIPKLKISGIIREAYTAGGDSGPNDMLDIIDDAGEAQTVGIYVNDADDLRYFQPGHRVEIVYALDELKAQPAKGGGVNYSRVAVSMSVSTQPAE